MILADIEEYCSFLKMNEKSANTISKYRRDVMKFYRYLDRRTLTKDTVLAYKDFLIGQGSYSTTSINSYIVAINSFFRYKEWSELIVKTCRIQKECFAAEQKELSLKEYRRLVKTAYSTNNERLALIIQTLCSTGIRISELKYITVENMNKNIIEVRNKGKNRKIIVPLQLQNMLNNYANRIGITSGAIFCTASGKDIDRSCIWKEMKKISKAAAVSECKVYPHNLRHLFARTFYNKNQDITQLADLLGHSDLNTTRLYLKTSYQTIVGILNQLELVRTT